MTDKRNHRILIQVADQEIADEVVGNVMPAMLRPSKLGSNATANFYAARSPSQNLYAEIDVINCTTLSLNKKDQQNRNRGTEIMYFDCVARTDSDPLIRNELSNLFDMLLIDQQNCCLVHFKPLREGPSSFFNNILIPEIERRIILLRSTLTLQSITLEYYDVQKYDIVNMFQKVRSYGTTKSQIAFRNTRELLRWTQHAFISLWSSGSEHDCFELEFSFVDAPNELEGIPIGIKKIKSRLSILQFYVSKMDGNMRTGLQNFFENMNQNTPRIKQSIITDYLREYFMSERESWLIWMLFDVPQINYGGSLVNDMLNIAKAANKGVRDNNEPMNNCIHDVIFSTANEKPSIPRQVGGVHYPSTYRKLESSNTSFNINVPSVKIGNYSLSFWYCHIEQSFLNVIAAMERYYDRKYDLRVQKMCNDLKYTTRNIDKDLHSPNIGLFDDKDIDDDDILKNFLKQYRDALSGFRILVQKVERTKYGDQLSVFMNSKNSEIKKQTREMKVRLLELCQVRLSNAIKDEVKTLKSDASLKSSNMSVDVMKITKKL